MTSSADPRRALRPWSSAPQPEGRLGSVRPAVQPPSLLSPGAKFVLRGPSGPLHLYSRPLGSATVLPCDTGRAGDPTIFHASFDFSVIPRKDGEVRDAADWTVAGEHLSVPAGGSWFVFNQRLEQVSEVLLFNEQKKKALLRWLKCTRNLGVLRFLKNPREQHFNNNVPTNEGTIIKTVCSSQVLLISLNCFKRSVTDHVIEFDFLQIPFILI